MASEHHTHPAELPLRQEEIKDRLDTINREWRGEKFSPEVAAEWNALNAELDDNKATLAQQRVREERLREIVRSGDDGHFEGEAYASPRRNDVTVVGDRAAHRSAGLRAIERNEDILPSDAGDRLTSLVREHDPHGLAARYLDAVADPAYASAFVKMLKDPTTGHLRFSAAEVEAMRRTSQVEAERAALAVGTGATGGFAVPFQLDPSIMISGAGAINPLRQIARVETGLVGEFRGVSSDQMVTQYQAEAAEVPDNAPTLVQPTVIARRGSAFVPFSIEVDQDWGSLQEEMSRMMADGRDVLDATKFVLGTGTNEPGGLLNIGGTGGLTTTQRVQTAGAGAFALGDVYLLKQALPVRFVPNGSIIGHPGQFDRVFRFVGGNSTEPPLMPDRAGPIVGKPAFEISSMVNTTTTGSRILIYGDFSNFLVYDVLGTTVELVPHLFGATNRFPNGQRGLVAFWRTGTGVLVHNAFRYLEVL